MGWARLRPSERLASRARISSEVRHCHPCTRPSGYRTEVLDCYVFDSLKEVRDMTADWLHRYNHHRPHEALGRIPPVEYRVKLFPNLYF